MYNDLKFDVARVTIEMTSPLLVGAPDEASLHDVTFTVDPNGNPTIPGPTIAGVWRHALAESLHADGSEERTKATHPDSQRNQICRSVFGFQDGDDAASSRIDISWAHVHNASNKPVSYGCQSSSSTSDVVLNALRAGIARDRVRINEGGVADAKGGGKFDEVYVPRGARFTFEVIYYRYEDSGGEASQGMPSLEDLLAILKLPHVRFGRNTRNGLGCFDVVAIQKRTFDLKKNSDDRETWKSYPVDISAPIPSNGDFTLQAGAALAADTNRVTGAWTSLDLELEAEDTWYFGGSVHPKQSNMLAPREREGQKGTFNWRMFPHSEPVITWSGTSADAQGSIRTEWAVPGSSLKGALRHRTLYHARRLCGAFWDTASGQISNQTAEKNAQDIVEHWFGAIAAKGGEGHAGRVMVDDLSIDPDEVEICGFDHVALDRFTQAPLDGCLFDEATLFGGCLKTRLLINKAIAPPTNGIDALRFALTDLATGLLPLGAASARGHGVFTTNLPKNLLSDLGAA